MDLTEEQWEAIRASFPGPERLRTSAKGGRPWRDPRDVLNGVLWVLRTGAPWADLPGRYPPTKLAIDGFSAGSKRGYWPRFFGCLPRTFGAEGKSI
jgi:transposase